MPIFAPILAWLFVAAVVADTVSGGAVKRSIDEIDRARVKRQFDARDNTERREK